MIKKQHKPMGFISRLVRYVNILAIVGLLLSYLAQYIPPDVFWLPAFFGLSYPLWFVLNFVFMLYWIYRRKRFFLFSLVFLLLGYNIPERFVGFGASKIMMDEENTFKLMSYNVHDFDYYSQSFSHGNGALNAIMAYIKKEDPDVICFQEFYSNPLKKDKNNFRLFRQTTDYKYLTRYKYNKRSSYLFLVIYSKYPIVHDGYLNPAPDNKDITGIYSDIKINNSIIRVYNVHLQSTMLTSKAYYLEKNYDLTKEEGINSLEDAGRTIMGRLKRAFRKRSLQVELLQNHLSSSPYPVVLAGDFNDTPVSYTYHRCAAGLRDAFTESGKGWVSTYRGKFPSFRIDYIFHDEYLSSSAFEKGALKASDHYPIHCVINTSNLQEDDR